MPLQNFVDNNLPTIKAAWLNSVDAFVNTLFASATTPTQAREALSISAQPTFRNRVMNGKFQIAQFANAVNVTGYICDQWLGAGSGGTWTASRQISVGLADFPQFGRMSSGAANTVSAGSFWNLQQRVEGVILDDLNWGTTSAVDCTLSFWARVSVPGTYSVALRAPNNTHSYVNTFSPIDTNWHQYVIRIPGPQVGTWPVVSNLSALLLDFTASAGSTFQTSVLASWQPGNFLAASTQTQMMTTNGATLDITGVQLERGVVATAFEHMNNGLELVRLQRYYETSLVYMVGYAPLAPMTVGAHLTEKVTKRTVPNISILTVYSVVGVSNAAYGYIGLGPPIITLTIGIASATWVYQVNVAIDARL